MRSGVVVVIKIPTFIDVSGKQWDSIPGADSVTSRHKKNHENKICTM